ncbi:hypothetical protein D9758_016158 [Tetrapyrgos nigripes]|uniref:NACHT domain-containing protein n=1 Tax=Tetrapyrgos nigripes TaxID=182062 RepID=A0A8H5CBS5_9AGAR|nr:hypothetical protein D9758_016158 [Tetrapyrgos nigripes]
MKRGIDNVTEQNKRKKLVLADPDTGPVGRAAENETYLDGQIPQGPRITAGRDVHMNNVQGDQNQTINNDYRQTVNSNNINNTFVMGDMNAMNNIKKWINAPDSSINFNAAYDKMTKGTGEWLLNDSRLIQWKESGGLLWLQGKAGSGKTFLLTKAITSLKADNHDVLYFYFDTRDQSKAKATYKGMLASLMLDMGLQFNQAQLMYLYETYSSGRTQMPADAMKSTLLDFLRQKSSSMFIFVDAFDECDNQEQHSVTEFIQQLLVPGLKIHICISCRYPAYHIGMNAGTYEISLNPDVVEGDIEIYIQQSLQSRPSFVNIKEEVTEALLHGSHGQIRWVDCQIQYFHQLGSWRAIRKALKSLPKTLEETYEQALNAVKKEHKEDAQAILKWLLFGYKELNMEMLPEILCIDFEQQVLDNPEPIQGHELCNIISSTLVVIQQVARWNHPRHNILQLGHPSVKEYIVSEEIKESSAKLFHINDQLAHEFIAQCCLIYLVDCGKGGHIDRERFPLAGYAVNSWTEHVRNLQQLGDPVKCLSLHLLTDTNISCLTWMKLTRYSLGPAAGSALPFYYASMVNLPNMILLMMENGADVNAQGGQYGTALQAASWGGNVDIVKLLLENGADLNAQGGQYGNALQAASSKGNVDIVKLLLENGADVNAQGEEYGTALQDASYRGYVDIVKLLLENGADVNAQGGKYSNALQAASVEGNVDIVKLLLENGADVNAQGGEYSNALWTASVEGNVDIVKLLLENGADVNAQGGKYSNALQAASVECNVDIVKLLLENGADVNAQGGKYSNALQAASAPCRGGVDIVKLLLENGADVNAQGGKYGNALQAASTSYGRGVDIVKLLLENGADVNAQGGLYGNALQAASYRGQVDIVKLLLENGADVNAQGGEYGNALQAASVEGNVDIVKLLLENGADVNAQGGVFGNALQAASAKLGGSVDIVKLLLENGADVNAQGGVYGTALQAASLRGYVDTVQLLLENGADVNAQGGRYGNALQAASFEGEVDIVKLLLENGADVNAQGGKYGNALQAASLIGYVDTVQLLLENGADVNAQGGLFGNALQAASFGRKVDIVKLLLENGADVNAQGGGYGNALQGASYRGAVDIVKFLLEKGADVNVKGGRYGTALQAASAADLDFDFDYDSDSDCYHVKLIKVLLDNRADINSRGGQYGSPIQAAAIEGNQEVYDLLIQKGATPIDPLFTIFQWDSQIPIPLMDNEPADCQIYCPLFWNM